MMTAYLPAGRVTARCMAVDTGGRKFKASKILDLALAGEEVDRPRRSTTRPMRAKGDTTWARRPATIPREGTLRFVNGATQNHFVALAKLRKGKTFADWKTWVRKSKKRRAGQAAGQVRHRAGQRGGQPQPGVDLRLLPAQGQLRADLLLARRHDGWHAPRLHGHGPPDQAGRRRLSRPAPRTTPPGHCVPGASSRRCRQWWWPATWVAAVRRRPTPSRGRAPGAYDAELGHHAVVLVVEHVAVDHELPRVVGEAGGRPRPSRRGPGARCPRSPAPTAVGASRRG